MFNTSYIFNLYKLYLSYIQKNYNSIFFFLFLLINTLFVVCLTTNYLFFSILITKFPLLFYTICLFYTAYIYLKLKSIIVDYINNEVSQLLLISLIQIIILYSYIILFLL